MSPGSRNNLDYYLPYEPEVTDEGTYIRGSGEERKIVRKGSEERRKELNAFREWPILAQGCYLSVGCVSLRHWGAFGY